jgi:hypothetical protein
VHQRPVEVGIQGSKLVEIKSGLNPGDRVIVGGQEKYQENEEINPEVQETQASETVQETGGMIDLKGEDGLAGQPDTGATDNHRAGDDGVKDQPKKPVSPSQRDLKDNSGGPH